MTYLKLDEDNQIYYEYVKPENDKSTFIFVNALTGNTTAWNGDIGLQIAKQGYGYIAYNFRGQDKSKFEKDLVLDTELIVSDLIKLIEHINPNKFILVGLSIGGLYASLAIEKGINALGLVLVNTLRKQSSRLTWINKTMVNAARVGGSALLMDMNMPVIASPLFLEKMEKNALNPENYIPFNENDGVFKLMKGSLNASWDFNWGGLDLPVLVMTGHYDRVFRIPEDIDELSNQIPNCKRVEIEDCGHLIPLENPLLFSEYLINFVKKIN